MKEPPVGGISTDSTKTLNISHSCRLSAYVILCRLLLKAKSVENGFFSDWIEWNLSYGEVMS